MSFVSQPRPRVADVVRGRSTALGWERVDTSGAPGVPAEEAT
jgi:hypothetical protein